MMELDFMYNQVVVIWDLFNHVEYLFALTFDCNDYIQLKPRAQKKTRAVSSVADSPDLRTLKRRKIKHVDSEESSQDQSQEKIPVIVKVLVKED